MSSPTSRPGLSKAASSHPAEADPARELMPRGMGEEQVVTFSFRGPKSLRTRLRIYSTRVDRPAQDIAVDAIREYLDRHER
jgi:hypothetical protein